MTTTNRASNPKKRFCCRWCPESFDTLGEQDWHAISCLNGWGNLAYLRTGRIVHTVRVKCPQCLKFCTSERGLKQHLTICGGSFTCRFCPHTLMQQCKMEKHEKICKHNPNRVFIPKPKDRPKRKRKKQG